MQLILDVAMIVGIYSVAVQVSVLGQLDIWKNAWIQVQKWVITQGHAYMSFR